MLNVFEKIKSTDNDFLTRINAITSYMQDLRPISKSNNYSFFTASTQLHSCKELMEIIYTNTPNQTTDDALNKILWHIKTHMWIDIASSVLNPLIKNTKLSILDLLIRNENEHLNWMGLFIISAIITRKFSKKEAVHALLSFEGIQQKLFRFSTNKENINTFITGIPSLINIRLQSKFTDENTCYWSPFSEASLKNQFTECCEKTIKFNTSSFAKVTKLEIFHPTGSPVKQYDFSSNFPKLENNIVNHDKQNNDISVYNDFSYNNSCVVS